MKKIVLLFLVLLIGAISSLAMFLLDDPPDENPEFYFTRLAYSENGIRGWGRFVSKNFHTWPLLSKNSKTTVVVSKCPLLQILL